MASNPNLTHRTDSKLRYASIHLQELKSYPGVGQAQDWERSHVESMLFHLTGALDAFLHELSDAHGLSLAVEEVRISTVGSALKSHNLQSKALERLLSLKKDRKGWLFDMGYFRNSATHRQGIRRQFSYGSGASDGVRLIGQDGSVTELRQIDLLEHYLAQTSALVKELRALLPSSP